MHHRIISAFPRVTAVCFLLFAPAALPAQTYVAAFPQFASGDGWSSDIFITNQGTSSGTVALSFYGDRGESLTVDNSLGSGSTFSITIGGGNTIAVRAGSGGPLKTGYALLSFPSGLSVRASEVFRYVQNGAVAASLGVAQQFPSSAYSFPAEVDVARGVNTAVAIANGAFDSSGSVAQGFVVSLIRSDGTLQGMAPVSLGPGGHVSKYLNESGLFPGLDGFTGTVCVSAAGVFGLVALRQDQAAFGTVSVDGGPILPPFMLTAAPIPEVENNDSTGRAQRISGATVVAGNVSFAGDVDFFQFSGTRGDIVTALASTASLGSGLDPVLYLLNADGTVFAENDDNGLFFQSDSFIQVVLPADGTYYLAVTDAQNRGGQNGYYRLHVQFLTPVAQGDGVNPPK